MHEPRFSAVPITLGARRILKPGRLRWLRATAWMVALFALVLLSFGGGLAAIHAIFPSGDPRFGFAASVGAAAIAVAVYAVAVRLGEDREVVELSPAGALPQLAVGIVAGTVMFVSVMGIMAALGLYRIDWKGPASAWHAAGLSIQAGFFEEVLVRAVMLRLLWRAFGPLAAFAVSALFFGASHLFNPGATVLAAICVALEAGVMLGAFYALTGRLWTSIGVHIAWNFAQGYIFGAAVSGHATGPSLARSVARPGAPAWETGGGFGPESSLTALVVCLLVGAVVLWLTYRAGRFEAVDAAG